MGQGVVAVSYGVSGNNGGSAASQFICQKLGEINEITKDSLVDINADLICHSLPSFENHLMAATLSDIYFGEDECCWFHTGNTRIYLIHNNKYLKQIIRDDTELDYLISTGKLSEKDRKSYPRKNVITACFGEGNSNLLRIQTSKINLPSFAFLITSDGIHDYFDIDEMGKNIFETRDYHLCCRSLTTSAIEHGSKDDLSVIVGVKQ